MKRNDGPHPTESTIVIPDGARNEMMLPDVLFILFLTHVGHVANVKKQPASLRSDSGPHHRNQRPTSPEYADYRGPVRGARCRATSRLMRSRSPRSHFRRPSQSFSSSAQSRG